MDIFPDAHIHFLLYLSSGHRPMLLVLQRDRHHYFSASPHMSPPWFLEPTFKNMVDNNRCNYVSKNPGDSFINNLRNFKPKARGWENFRSLKNKKFEALEKLKFAQREFEHNPSRKNLHRGVALYK